MGPALTGVQCVVEGATHDAVDGAVALDPEWRFAAGASFTCTGTLPALAAAANHVDAAKVEAVSVTSGERVGDQDLWHAVNTTPKKVSVGDYVWEDADKDGLQDEDESGIGGVELTLTGPDGQSVTDVNGKPVGPVKTDDRGGYTFEGLPVLPAGEHYTVTVKAPEGYEPTQAGAGDDRGRDSSTGSAE